MKVFLVTNSEGFYGQRSYPWESIDISYLIDKLSINYEVEHITFERIVNSNINIEDSIILYSSSQQSEYKEYIEDILIYLMQKGNHLVPSFNVFKSHENKGFQELHKKLLNIQSIPVQYYGHHKEVLDKNINFPSVIKVLDGFGSGGVELINNKEKIIDFSTKNDCLIKKTFIKKIRNLIAKPIKKYIFFKKEKNLKYGDYFDYFKRFVIQDFIPNLTYDYKVLVFNKKYYVLKRFTNDGDFRASGSGKFAFEKVENELLAYSKLIYERFDEPIMGFDMCYDGKKYFLIEFQGTHFGPYTLLNSEGYYELVDNNWVFIKEKSNLDDEISSSLLAYLNKKY